MHAIPVNEFVVNKRLQTLLDIRLNTLQAGPLFNDCNNRIIYEQIAIRDEIS